MLLSVTFAYGQVKDPGTESADYLADYDSGKYSEALNIIRKKLAAYYGANTDTYKIPDEYIFHKKEDRKDINEFFRKRKIHKFFIEENEDLFNLHLYAARCYAKLQEWDAALNHYYESLRYNSPDAYKDDYIFYEISQVYKNSRYYRAYTAALETAYSLNPTKFEYSLELGTALSTTGEKKKAIYHLRRYVESRGDDIDNPGIFITLGNLNEDVGKFLETVKYYKKYLAKKPDDGYVSFALGYLAYRKTGDHRLALECFDKAIRNLPENDLYRHSKAAEYKADIFMKDLEYEKAIEFYLETKKYHDKIKTRIRENSDNISSLDADIRKIKSTLGSEMPSERYSKYESLQNEKGRMEMENRQMNYEFGKLNAGKITWNLAELHERLDKLNKAVEYYNETISFDYNPDKARDKIKKLKLKINRGY